MLEKFSDSELALKTFVAGDWELQLDKDTLIEIASSLAWILEFSVFLLRHMYIFGNLKDMSSKKTGSFLPLLQPSPLIFFLHPSLNRLLQQNLLCLHVIKHYVNKALRQPSLGDNLGPQSSALLRQVDHYLSRTYLREKSFLDYLRSTRDTVKRSQVFSPSEIVDKAFLSGKIPAAAESLLASFKNLFTDKLQTFFGIPRHLHGASSEASTLQQSTEKESSNLEKGSFIPIDQLDEIRQCLLSHAQPSWLGLWPDESSQSPQDLHQLYDAHTKCHLWRKDLKLLSKCSSCGQTFGSSFLTCFCGGLAEPLLE